MKKIKFRAWDKEFKRFDHNHHIMMSLTGHVQNFQNGEGGDTYILSQYVGLRDKNGKEIYEGDIVSVDTKEPGYSCESCGDWHNGYTKQTIEQVNWENHNWAIFSVPGEMEVIGNIFENPDLADKEVV